MANHKKKPPLFNEEIDLFVLISVAWNQKLLFLKIILVVMAFTILILQLVEHKYTVSIKVTPVSSSSSNNVSLNRLANLAGTDLGQNSETNTFELYLEGIHSIETATTLAKNEALLKRAFPGYWNSSSNEWAEPRGIIPFLKKSFNILVGRPFPSIEKPGGAKFQEFLQKKINISESLDSSIVTYSIETADIAFGKEVLSELNKIVDEQLRIKSLERTEQQIRYLTIKLSDVKNNEHRQVLSAALLKQENTRMMASSNVPFAAEPFGAPYQSIKPTNPNPFLVIPGAIFFSLFIGGLWIIRKQYIAQELEA